MTNGKSYTGFPTSYRWSTYVTLSLPKGGSKSELFFVWNKSQLQLNEVCYKVSLRKTSSRKVVVHSFPYLTVHRCWGNTDPSTSNVASKWRTPWWSAELEIFRLVVPQLWQLTKYSFITYRKSITVFPTGYRYSTYLSPIPQGWLKTPLRNSSAASAS